jgi:2-amino-4-hydroxy-6-hydroxymethyldihydropteridine diphosphokinase
LEHITRVATLLREWAGTREETPVEAARWVAAGYLHDALRDEEHDTLRRMVDEPFHELPGKVLHGPGSARRLRDEGVDDEELLHAIAFHTLGSAEFGTLGFALFAADFLEPGRKFREDWRADLRRRAPLELAAVVKEILAARIGHLLEQGRPVHPLTLGFWNRISEGQPWASASEY